MNDDQQDLDDWINQVYYGSCCSHSEEGNQKRIDTSDSSLEKRCEANNKKAQKDPS